MRCVYLQYLFVDAAFLCLVLWGNGGLQFPPADSARNVPPAVFARLDNPTAVGAVQWILVHPFQVQRHTIFPPCICFVESIVDDLLQVQGRTLFISGVDLVDGTPILDVKPYIREIFFLSFQRSVLILLMGRRLLLPSLP